MLNFTLKQLEIFSAVAEYNSFTAAAEALYLSQSTVSSHIAELERALGVTLFSRSVKKRIELTDRGREVYASVQRILLQCELLVNPSGGQDREIVIGTSTVPADHLLPGYMAEFLKLLPDCRFVIKRGDSATVHEMLRRQQVQLALVGTALDLQHFDYMQVAQDTLVVITPNTEEYGQLQQQGCFGRELLARPLIFREAGSGTQRATDAYLSRIGLGAAQINVVAQIDSPEGIMNAVCSHVGIAVMSALAVRSRVRSGELLEFPLDNPPVTREVFLAWRKGDMLPACADAFRTMLKQQ